MVSTEKHIPTAVEQIDKAWFDSILDEPVVDARIVDVIHGTATKVKAELSLGGTGAPARVQTVWVKIGLEPHSKSGGTDQVYAGETFFYRHCGGKYETRTPECLFADTDADGNSVLVLEDLCKYGAEFVDATRGGSVDAIGRGLEAIARYQAASWMAPELYRMEWLRKGGCYQVADVLAYLYEPTHWEDYSKRPRYQVMPPQLRDRATLHRAHIALRDDWWRRKPWVLCHGDAHFGQVYYLPDGEARLVDWQCVQIAHWAHDMSYFMVSGLSIEDRRKYTRDLLAHYTAKLREFGVETAPSPDEAYDAFCAYVFHGIGWVMCYVEWQPEETCVAMTERFSSAILELGTLDILLGNGR